MGGFVLRKWKLRRLVSSFYDMRARSSTHLAFGSMLATTTTPNEICTVGQLVNDPIYFTRVANNHGVPYSDSDDDESDIRLPISTTRALS